MTLSSLVWAHNKLLICPPTWSLWPFLFAPVAPFWDPWLSFSGDSEQSACSRDPIRSTVSLPLILSPPPATQGCNSSCDTHTHTHSPRPAGLLFRQAARPRFVNTIKQRLLLTFRLTPTLHRGPGPLLHTRHVVGEEELCPPRINPQKHVPYIK